MATESLEFAGATGERLSARIDLPVHGAPHAWMLFAHCFTCSKDLGAVTTISRALNRQGVAVFRFDFTGLGGSDGDFADTDFTSNVGDLVAAGRFMAETGRAPDILLGHSLGGSAALHAAHELPSVRAVATIGAPSDADWILSRVDESSGEGADGSARTVVKIGNRNLEIGRGLIEDLRSVNMSEAVSGLDRALLLLHSPVDEIVSVESAATLYEKAKHPKSYVSLDEADHLLTRPEDARYVGRVLAAWASKYVDLTPTDVAAAPQGSGDERVVVRLGRDHYRTDVWADGHYIVADEPPSNGGGDEGPAPYDFLATALGTCTAITVRMYADRKEWPLEAVEVVLRHTRQHAADVHSGGGEGEASSPARIDRIERELAFVGDLDEAQLERLAEIADRCPVHRTLDSGVEVVTRVVGRPLG